MKTGITFRWIWRTGMPYGSFCSRGRGSGTPARTFKLPDFSTALGLVVRVGLVAEKRDHHPDVELGWGRARVVWTTHDQKGVTSLDTELAEATDAIVGRG